MTSEADICPPHTLPPVPQVPALADGEVPNPWSLFNSRIEFNFAHYHFVEVQSSAEKIDQALDMWAATVMEFGGDSPWENAAELYATINAIQHGDSPWRVYHICYQGPLPPGMPPKWMVETYELCTQDSCQVLHHQLATTAFKDKINLTPYHQFDGVGRCSWSNLMSADWAWKQAVQLLYIYVYY